MSTETLDKIREKRIKLEVEDRIFKKPVGRISKYHGDYYHTQTILHKDEKQSLLNITRESMQESLRMAVLFYIENKKDDKS